MTKLMSLARIQLVVIVIFAVLKFTRNMMLQNAGLSLPDCLVIFLYSFPNFAEAIVGTITITVLLMVIGGKVPYVSDHVSDFTIYGLSTFLAGIYVITQELHIHNLGGANVYDVNDILFSIAGLVIAYALLLLVRPKMVRR